MPKKYEERKKNECSESHQYHLNDKCDDTQIFIRAFTNNIQHIYHNFSYFCLLNIHTLSQRCKISMVIESSKCEILCINIADMIFGVAIDCLRYCHIDSYSTVSNMINDLQYFCQYRKLNSNG